MNIPLEKLISKMEVELQGAKDASSDSAVRERIHALKTLCELVLDESPIRAGERPRQIAIEAASVPKIPPAPLQPIYHQSQQQPIQQPGTKRLEMDDGANGDSLLDF